MLILPIRLSQGSTSRSPPKEPPPSHPPKVQHTRSGVVPRATVRYEIAGLAFVTDGDGLRIKNTEIRLFGIDAPEFGHPLGKKAKWALHRLCKGQKIRAEVTGKDSHGRTVAKCFLPDGRDLSSEMVKLGLALDWPKYSGGVYAQFETPDARKKLWLADARQKGRMHIWDKYEARRKARATGYKAVE
ncbi:thermonuclease family protein [Yoonia sp. BS5-3]|uniref:Thermonuclease family protein n=1 Tax=Yoonia phaeophyticola TaxID=3137369 RepID=A0ABZ2V9W7_9RHOB